MNLWYVHLVQSNLNWVITAVTHLVCLIFNVYVFIRQSTYEEDISVKVIAILIKTIVCVVYIYLAYLIEY